MSAGWAKQGKIIARAQDGGWCGDKWSETFQLVMVEAVLIDGPMAENKKRWQRKRTEMRREMDEVAENGGSVPLAHGTNLEVLRMQSH